MKIRYELILWYSSFLKRIPGNIGCFLRRKLLPLKIGKGSKIWDFVQIDSPSKISIGKNVSINRYSILHGGGGIDIGDDVLIGPNVTIYSQSHKFTDKFMKIREQGYVTKKVVIGNNTWIASNVIILPGVVIGDNCVIAAGTIVTKSVPNNTLIRNKISIFDSKIQ
jgi:maltose O-acetyltransferase